MNAIEKAAEALKKGEVVIFPTETVYGLGASIACPEAIRQIFTLKRRPFDNPLIVHVASPTQALELIDNPPKAFFRLTNCFWPGPLALVLKKKEFLTNLVSAGLPSVALRMPSHPVARALIEKVGPLAAPSANLSGRPSPTSMADALEDFEGKVPFALDGGNCSVGIESTVVSLLDKTPVLLRSGWITREQIEDVLGMKLNLPNPQNPPLSPGMKYRHYAPRARLKLVYEETKIKGPVTLYNLTTQKLYAELRRCDRENVAEIEIFCDAAMQNNPALMDRLHRAAAKNI